MAYILYNPLSNKRNIEEEANTEMVAINTGHNISVKFDRPTSLQIDGETILGVTEYRVNAKGLRKQHGTNGLEMQV